MPAMDGRNECRRAVKEKSADGEATMRRDESQYQPNDMVVFIELKESKICY